VAAWTGSGAATTGRRQAVHGAADTGPQEFDAAEEIAASPARCHASGARGVTRRNTRMGSLPHTGQMNASQWLGPYLTESSASHRLHTACPVGEQSNNLHHRYTRSDAAGHAALKAGGLVPGARVPPAAIVVNRQGASRGSDAIYRRLRSVV